MTEQEFVDAGAECVGGDLILNRVLVGRYRHGQFLPTDEGLMMEAPAAPVAAPAPAPAPAPAAARAPKASKTKAPEAPVAPPAADPDPLAGLEGLGLGDDKA